MRLGGRVSRKHHDSMDRPRTKQSLLEEAAYLVGWPSYVVNGACNRRKARRLLQKEAGIDLTVYGSPGTHPAGNRKRG
jgi:hypothetical protein